MDIVATQCYWHSKALTECKPVVGLSMLNNMKTSPLFSGLTCVHTAHPKI